MLAVFLGVSQLGGVTYAANNSTLNQNIAAGAFSVDIRDGSGNTVASPSVTMGGVTFSFVCQAATGTLGTPTERIRVDNPTAATSWTINIGATGGATAVWDASVTGDDYDYNDPNGCTDGADTDTEPGQLTIDPTTDGGGSPSTLTADPTCGCTTTGITKGSATGFEEGVNGNQVNILTGSSADAYGRWYLEGVGLSQDIPASQSVDDYTIDLTLDAVAS